MIDLTQKYCSACGTSIDSRAEICPSCGVRVAPPAAIADASDKSRTAALLLCFFLGVLGAHRFYVGKVGTGLVWLFTIGILGIGALVDLISIITGTFKDIDGKRLLDWNA